ncbi:MAG: glutamate--cysteine ligase [Pseudomonadota bacterium]|nr:glutamate--cysteine ligase [Pseudomonadota bacterium]
MSKKNIKSMPISNFSSLASFLEEGCKEKKDWMIGTEHEKFGFIKNSMKPLPYQGSPSIKSILLGLKDDFGWRPIFENGELVGLKKNGAQVTLEPGGQLELSGAPLKSIHATCSEASRHLKEVKSVAEKIGVGFIGLGASPDWKHNEMPKMPKGRYKLMTDYMTKVGKYGHQMMYRTCTIQVNLDFASEKDMVKKYRTSLALQPIATALFANSPFFEGSLAGYKSWRARIWQDLDDSRTGMLPFVFEDGMGFERYVDFALDVPMYFVQREGKYINALGQSFRDFMNGALPALPGQRPLISDWEDHLTTLFPEVRLKQFLEMRGADGGPWNRICALPALWVGLLYDENALDAAWDLCKNWTAEDRDNLRIVASRDGLNGIVDKISIRNVASEILKISRHGLRGREKYIIQGNSGDESQFLDILDQFVERSESPADELIKKFDLSSYDNLSAIYHEYSY